MENLYENLCSFENIYLAYKKARRHKTIKLDVTEFEKDLKTNLLMLQIELLTKYYFPKPLKCFVIADPKTRKIHKSNFRDRIVHHAICNLIEPLFEKIFIYDSYANRKSKGTLKAIERFDQFKRKVSRNNNKVCFVLKADIKHYFDNVNHKILMNILQNKVLDKDILNLIQIILNNYSPEKGMPLGNLTSQFFANVYLNELDQYVKHNLKIKYYIRYVDDFIIFSNSKEELKIIKQYINLFLQEKLKLELHPDKSKIISLNSGVTFLGANIFYYHKLIPKKNKTKFKRKYLLLKNNYPLINNYELIYNFMEGWLAYIRNFDSYKLSLKYLNNFQSYFKNGVSSKEVNRLVKASFTKKKIINPCELSLS